jgi:hypothetical protein
MMDTPQLPTPPKTYEATYTKDTFHLLTELHEAQDRNDRKYAHLVAAHRLYLDALSDFSTSNASFEELVRTVAAAGLPVAGLSTPPPKVENPAPVPAPEPKQADAQPAQQLLVLSDAPPPVQDEGPKKKRKATTGHNSPKICRKSWKSRVHKNLSLFFVAVQKSGRPGNGPLSTDDLLNWIIDASTRGTWADQELIDRLRSDNKLRGTWATWLRSVLDPKFKHPVGRVKTSRCFKQYVMRGSTLVFEDVPNPAYTNRCLFRWVRNDDPGTQPYITKTGS